ncbi:MAG: ParA family protein [Opitutales bacterium]|nr:ParA family protein [Opitutales bacterium]NRA27496.1 ParA family protein [Opitutales bacterium]
MWDSQNKKFKLKGILVRVTILNRKGGVGKSTVAILLGAALDSAGFEIAFDDRDPQGTVSYWAQEIGGVPMLEDGGNPRVTIVDTPGRLDLHNKRDLATVRELIATSDRLVVVTEKSPFSVRASEPMVELVKEHQSNGASAWLLFNKVRANTRIGRQEDRELVGHLGIAALKNSLPLAAPFENVQIDGYKAVTGKNRELVLKLALEIIS